MQNVSLLSRRLRARRQAVIQVAQMFCQSVRLLHSKCILTPARGQARRGEVSVNPSEVRPQPSGMAPCERIWNGQMSELPFGTMNNRKRVALILLSVLDEMENDNLPMVRGLLVQAMRWIILDLENPKDALTSWRLTFLADPVPLVTPSRGNTPLDLNNTLLDPGQLTATLGMSRDMELLSKRLKGQQDDHPKPQKDNPKPQKDNDKDGKKGKKDKKEKDNDKDDH